MTPRSFEYFDPPSLQKAVGLLSKYRENAKVIAGGQSLVPMMKLRLVSPRYVIDLRNLRGLSYIHEVEGDKISIGAMTTHWEIESSPILKDGCPLLCEAARDIGDVQIRNRGTIGGSLAHADPSADYPPVILALGAELQAEGPKRTRVIKADDFFVDYFTTSLRHNEILKKILVPKVTKGYSYLKLERGTGDFSIVSSAVLLETNGRGVCKDIRVALGGVAPTPVRARKTEDYLKGKSIDDRSIEEAAASAADGIKPPSDLMGSSEYRLAMIKVFTKRAIKTALSRRGGA